MQVSLIFWMHDYDILDFELALSFFSAWCMIHRYLMIIESRSRFWICSKNLTYLTFFHLIEYFFSSGFWTNLNRIFLPSRSALYNWIDPFLTCSWLSRVNHRLEFFSLSSFLIVSDQSLLSWVKSRMHVWERGLSRIVLLHLHIRWQLLSTVRWWYCARTDFISYYILFIEVPDIFRSCISLVKKINSHL